MENENSAVESEKSAVESVKSSRKRSASSSSSEDTSASTSESDSSRRKSRKVRKRDAVSNNVHVEFLSQQVAFLTNLISQNYAANPVSGACTNVTNTGNAAEKTVQISNEKTVQNSNDLELRGPTESSDKIEISEFSTTVKDPIYPKASDPHLSRLSQLQRFKNDDWYAIRFSETQKKYVASPGFVELSVNDELKRLEAAAIRDDPRSHLLERTFASLTNAILTQKDELQRSLQMLVDWSNAAETNLTSTTLFAKIKELFAKDSAYSKVSDDLSQVVCGRRADLINTRREAILRQIPDDYHRDVLQKIPPTPQHLFDCDLIQSYLQKIGGVDKLMTHSRPSVHQNNFKDNLYQRSKPSTSRQNDESFFRNTPAKKTKTSNNRSGQSYRGKNGNKNNQKGKKPRSRTPPRGKRSQ